MRVTINPKASFWEDTIVIYEAHVLRNKFSTVHIKDWRQAVIQSPKPCPVPSLSLQLQQRSLPYVTSFFAGVIFVLPCVLTANDWFGHIRLRILFIKSQLMSSWILKCNAQPHKFKELVLWSVGQGNKLLFQQQGGKTEKWSLKRLEFSRQK